jgi:hypothetical protein
VTSDPGRTELPHAAVGAEGSPALGCPADPEAAAKLIVAVTGESAGTIGRGMVPRVRSLGDLVTTGIGLAAAIRIWQVFPFDLSSGWSAAVRVLLVVAIGGSCIALVVQVVSFARWFAGRAPQGSRMRTGH